MSMIRPEKAEHVEGRLTLEYGGPARKLARLLDDSAVGRYAACCGNADMELSAARRR